MRKKVAPAVSRMKKGDISREIDMLRGRTAETPLVAATPSAPQKYAAAAVENIKEAKAEGFPVKPLGAKAGGKAVAPDFKADKMASVRAAKKKVVKRTDEGKKTGKKEKLLAMLAEMSDSD